MGRKTYREARRLRVYEQWQGNERFFCWGHCVTGPSWKSGLGSLALLVAPTVVFLVFVAPYMAQRVTPAILVISCVLPVFCAAMLLMTSCRDPGILPRQEPDEEWLNARKPRTRDVSVNGHRVTVRYNDTCHFYQPPRAHHCSVNDNCIERFDHHCPWVGTTIGKRNYRTFLLFIYATSIYIAWTFGVSLGSLFVRHGELEAAAAQAAGGAQQQQQGGDSLSSNLWLQTLGQSGAALALMIFTFIFFWFVCGLSGFHTWLVATNQTTYENFRYNHNQVPNPYNEGVLRNCASVWCVRVPPSKVQFRAFLDEVVVRQPVELGYPDWVPPAAAMSATRTPSLTSQQPMGAAAAVAAGAGSLGAGASPLGGYEAGGGGGDWGGPASASPPANGTAAAAAASAGQEAYGGEQQQQPLPPAAQGAAQSFDSMPDTSAQMPLDRAHTRGYSSSSPPSLHTLTAAGAAGGGGGGAAAAAGGAAAAGPSRSNDSSPYHTPLSRAPPGATAGAAAAQHQQQQLTSTGRAGSLGAPLAVAMLGSASSQPGGGAGADAPSHPGLTSPTVAHQQQHPWTAGGPSSWDLIGSNGGHPQQQPGSSSSSPVDGVHAASEQQVTIELAGGGGVDGGGGGRRRGPAAGAQS